jgi:hypothetical protein
MRVVAALLLAAAYCFGTLNHIYVDQRLDVEKAKDFGAAGPYERIVASAVYEPGVKIAMDYLKPRDPAKGNGAIVLLTGGSGNLQPLMHRGYTVLRMKTGDAAAIREMITFLRYGGGPDALLLGDQRRFLKRAILVGDPTTIESILLTNEDSKKRRLIDGLIVTGGKPFKAPSGVKSLAAKGALNDTVLELDAQLSAPSK